MKIGDKVIATFPDDSQSDVGTIIEGPIFRDGAAVFKVRHPDFDNWLPAVWLRPYLRAVNSN
ncbi:MAG: hypothetical protein AAFX90_12595 [Pseudomonadota bacterium]